MKHFLRIGNFFLVLGLLAPDPIMAAGLHAGFTPRSPMTASSEAASKYTTEALANVDLWVMELQTVWAKKFIKPLRREAVTAGGPNIHLAHEMSIDPGNPHRETVSAPRHHDDGVMEPSSLPPPDPDKENRVYARALVVDPLQKAIFIGANLFFSAGTIILAHTVLIPLLIPTFGPGAVAATWTYYVFHEIGRAIHMYQILGMKRAVLNDPTVPKGKKIAMVTTFVPSKEPIELLAQKIEGMARVERYGNVVDFYVLDEGDDPEVKRLIDVAQHQYGPQGFNIHHFTRKGIPQYNQEPGPKGEYTRFQTKQKAGNVNSWWDSIDPTCSIYDFLTVIDLDHIPQPDFYAHVLPYFKDTQIAFVQGPESLRNRGQNLITQAATAGAEGFFGTNLRVHFGLDMPIIVGSHTTFRMKDLKDLGQYAVHPAEDLLLALQMWSKDKPGIYTDAVIAIGEVPSSWESYIMQQVRWASSTTGLLFRYLPKYWSSYSLKEKFFALRHLSHYLYAPIQIINKLILCIALLKGVVVAPALFPWLLLTALIPDIFAWFWQGQFRPEPEKKRWFLSSSFMMIFLTPYFALAVIQAVIQRNLAFVITPKSTSQQVSNLRLFQLPMIIATLDAVVLALYSFFHSSGIAFNGLAYPLVISVLINLAIVLRHHSIERAEGQDTSPQELQRLRFSVRGANPASQLLALLMRRWKPIRELNEVTVAENKWRWRLTDVTGRPIEDASAERTRRDHLQMNARALDALLAGDYSLFEQLDPAVTVAQAPWNEQSRRIRDLSPRAKRILVLASTLEDCGYYQAEGQSHQDRGIQYAKSLLADESSLVRETVEKVILGHADLWMISHATEQPALFLSQDNLTNWIAELRENGALRNNDQETTTFRAELRDIFVASTLADIQSSGDRHLTDEKFQQILTIAGQIFGDPPPSSRGGLIRRLPNTLSRFSRRSA